MKKSLFPSLIALFCCAMLLAGCSAWESSPVATPLAEKAFDVPDRSMPSTQMSAIEAFRTDTESITDYLLYDGDDINIDVIGRPELSGLQRIGPDGRISLPVVGSVSVRNLTREKAAEVINTALSPYYLNILTTVRVDHYNSNRIIIIGRVEHPGELLFNTPPKLLEILAQAGGMPLLRQEQVLTRCAVIRKDKILWIDLARLLTGDTSLNVPLQRNDVVYIPDASDTSVFVLGAVDHPGVLRLTPQMSFMDALGQAGGLTKEGNYHDIHLIRPNEKVNMQIDLDDLLEPQPGLNVAIKQGDIIFVPRHNVSKVSYILQQISPFAFLLAIAQFGLVP